MKVSEVLEERSLGNVFRHDMERFKKNQYWDDIESSDIDTEKFDKVKAHVGQYIKGGVLTIFRAEAFVGDYINHLERTKTVGQFWTYHPESAQVFRGKNDYTDDYILVAQIKEEYIDWEATLSLHTIATRGNIEREIRLFKNTPIKLKAVYKKHDKSNKIDELDLGNLKYMRLKARSRRDQPSPR